MIEVKNITKTFKDKVALEGVSLTLPRTGLVLIYGENGSGKSTLLNIIGALDKPTKGTVLLDGVELNFENEKELCRYREEHVGFIFQNDSLFENMTVIDNIKIVGGNAKFDKIVDFLHIRELLNKKAKELSGGERQKVSIARALMKNPNILLADEPTSSLDRDTKREIMTFLRTLSKTRLVIVITHDDVAPEDDAEIIINMKEGKISKLETRNPNVHISKADIEYKNKIDLLKTSKNVLFTNKKKLARSSLLFTITFLLLIVTTILGHVDYKDMEIDTITKENDGRLAIHKMKYENGHYITDEEGFTEKDLEYLNKEKITEKPLLITESFRNSHMSLIFKINIAGFNGSYYGSPIFNYYFISSKELKDVKYGTKPTKEDEVVISTYIGELMVEYGLEDENGEEYKPVDLQAIITDHKRVKLGTKSVIISGMYETDYSAFESLKKDNTGSFDWQAKSNTFMSFTNKRSSNIYVQDNFKDYILKGHYTPKYAHEFYLEDKYKLNDRMVLLDEEESSKLDLSENELYLNEETADKLGIIKDNLPTEITLNIKTKDHIVDEKISLTVKGLRDENYINSSSFEKYIQKNRTINRVYVHETDKKTLAAMMDKFPKDYSEYIMSSNYTWSYALLKENSRKILIILKAFSVIFIILSVVYLMNYLKNSIRTHKKDIAILKSLGIQNGKILSLFTIEMSIVSTISYLVATVLYCILKLPVNKWLSDIFVFDIEFLQINLTLVTTLACILLANIVLSFLGGKRIKKISPEEIFKGDVL